MKRMFAVLMLIVSMLSLSHVAKAADPVPAPNPAVTDCGANGESKACLSAPVGTLKDSQKTKDFVAFMQWALFLSGAVACVIFGLKCASRISDEQWREAFGPGVGSFLAGAVSYIAFRFIS